jgi:hypothetical protein
MSRSEKMRRSQSSVATHEASIKIQWSGRRKALPPDKTPQGAMMSDGESPVPKAGHGQRGINSAYP